MICPFCLHKKSEIYNTRSKNQGSTVWRRRRCLSCGKTFTTRESTDPSTIWKIKSAKTITPYSRAKLAMSLLRACDHRSNEDRSAWYLFEAVEQQLYPIAVKKNNQLQNTDIYTKVTALLKRFDAVAYVKYMSYHQPTMDVRTLRKQLRDG